MVECRIVGFGKPFALACEDRFALVVVVEERHYRLVEIGYFFAGGCASALPLLPVDLHGNLLAPLHRIIEIPRQTLVARLLLDLLQYLQLILWQVFLVGLVILGPEACQDMEVLLFGILAGGFGHGR